MSNNYLSRYAWKEPLFSEYPSFETLSAIIVIPSFKEENILHALNALNACEEVRSDILIIVVVNDSINDSEEIKKVNEITLKTLETYSSRLPLLFKRTELPNKKAGVGLARKIGMDEAVRIFEQHKTNGLIACYDADSSCDTNYLKELEKCFYNDQFQSGVVFHEHVLDGVNEDEIIQYELFLRYYVDAIRVTGFPFAHQTLGSCIVVRSDTYQLVGGMNTRKAGEDFYFLNKLVSRPGFYEINRTTIYPSDRVSDRVPFGTGKAVSAIKKDESDYCVYHPKMFEMLKQFFDGIERYWNKELETIPQEFLSFDKKLSESIARLANQTSSFESFRKRFYDWFDLFQIMKFAHYFRDNHLANVSLSEALNWLGTKGEPLNGDFKSILWELRTRNRNWSRSDQIGS